MTEKKFSAFKRLSNVLLLDKKDVYYIYLYAILSGVVDLSLPVGVQYIISLITGGIFSSSWGVMVFLVTLGTSFAGALKMMQLQVTELLQRKLFVRAALDYSLRLPSIAFEYYHKKNLPAKVDYFMDTVTLQKGIPKILIDYLSAIIQIFFGLILITFYNSLFLLFGLSLIVIIYLLFRITGKKGFDTSMQESAYKYKIKFWLSEIAANITTFLFSNNNKLIVERTDRWLVSYLEARRKHFRLLLLQYGGMVFFKTAFVAILLILGSTLVINNQINLGQFVAVEIVIILIINSVEKLILTSDVIYDVLTSVEKLGMITDISIEKDQGLLRLPSDLPSGYAVELRNVKFSYPEAIKSTFQQLNLTIASGDSLCLIGENASGKNTIAKILSRIYTKYEGAMLINGITTNSLSTFQLRDTIGYCGKFQELFSGTIYDNIVLGRDNITSDNVKKVLEKLCLDEFVNALPFGLLTHYESYHYYLPSSILTKIKLARAIIHAPKLLVIEDVFGAFDHKERAAILSSLLSGDPGYTTVIISNDEGLAALCTKVAILENGVIVALDRHENLKSNPLLRSIYDN